jgi:hypothetical protein
MKNTTDTMQHALAKKAFMWTVGEVHQWQFTKCTSGTLKNTIAIGIGITLIV